MSAVVATFRAALAEAVAKRASFVSQVVVMVLNDLVWIVFWVLFFRRVGTLHHWDRDRIILLQATLTTAGGITLGLVANARHLGSLAVRGELDAALALPVPPLAYVLARKVEPTNLGDLAFGVGVFVLACHPTLERSAVFALVVVLAAAVATGFLVLVGSSAFFLGRADAGELGFQALILTGSYPSDVYAGMARTLLYTLMPAAFVATVPAQLVTVFDAVKLAALGAAAVVFCAAGWWAFTVGLRRYCSGSVWTRA